jgi:hypothetical protein
MLFEAQLDSPHESAYQQHQFLVNLFVNMEDLERRRERFLKGESPTRDYLWCESDGVLLIRRAQPTNALAWQPVEIPPVNSLISFQLQARCRKNTGDLYPRYTWQRGHALFTRGSRNTTTDPTESLVWLGKAAQKIGLDIEDAEVEVGTKIINKYNITRSRRRARMRIRSAFTLETSNFYGVAKVRDPQQFEQGLIHGVGDAKAFGLGYIIFWERGKHDAA